MSLTIDCGEGRHTVCSGSGTDVYLIPQESGERFSCGCKCHQGMPMCKDCGHYPVRKSGDICGPCIIGR